MEFGLDRIDLKLYIVFLSEGNHFYLYEINETGIKVVSEKLSRLNGITSKVVLKWYRIIKPPSEFNNQLKKRL